MIDDMVNFELFEKFDRFDDINLTLRTSSHQRLFNVLLGDFLSQPRKWGGNPMVFDLPSAPHTGPETDRTNLFYIRRICKHNLVRLENNVGKICDILGKHGHPIDEARGYLVLSDFYDWFHRDIFAYHASTIAEHLNEIRWAIFHTLNLNLTDHIAKSMKSLTNMNIQEPAIIPLERVCTGIHGSSKSAPPFPSLCRHE